MLDEVQAEAHPAATPPQRAEPERAAVIDHLDPETLADRHADLDRDGAPAVDDAVGDELADQQDERGRVDVVGIARGGSGDELPRRQWSSSIHRERLRTRKGLDDDLLTAADSPSAKVVL